MTITVPITPELEARLTANAARYGMELPDYAATLLADGVGIQLHEKKMLTPEELEASLDRMAKFSHKIPSLPDEAFSRESLYRDHD